MMLSRIANGLYDLGRAAERAQHVARILEVNHKMNLERADQDEVDIWLAISESFHCNIDRPDERRLYEILVLSSEHPYSVQHCIRTAREEGRAMREHISEEMWLHLNHTHLEFKTLTFDSILEMGRSEFNRRVEIFSDALHGLADDTMIRGESWAFLKIGKLMERAMMICRILEIKQKSLVSDGDSDSVDVHQWQALLRSLSGYEPYRRAYDARIIPTRVVEFVLKRGDFPRSLSCCLSELRSAISIVSGHNPLQSDLDLQIAHTLEELRLIQTADLLTNRTFESYLLGMDATCKEITEAMDLAYFTSLRPASVPISASPGAGLVPQQ